mmetsp:Transcript_8223/g.16594  ORF Transcript_8223/g.16594 Transcript_8223/m.16594 type:complete len:136 (+) Transcript_8223:187-594(+)
MKCGHQLQALIALITLTKLALSFLPPPPALHSNYNTLNSRPPFHLQSNAENTVELVTRIIKSSPEISPTSVTVTTDETDPNGSHCTLTVVSPSFTGLTTLKRQRMVYKAMWDVMDTGRIHAVDGMTCLTEEEERS